MSRQVHVSLATAAALLVAMVAPTGAAAQARIDIPASVAPPTVELLSFNLSASTRTITLTWRTAQETGNVGFEVQRSDESDTASYKAFANYLTDSRLAGLGTNPNGKGYTYIDADPYLQTGKIYCYRLVTVSTDNTRTGYPAACIQTAVASSVPIANDNVLPSSADISFLRLNPVTPNPAGTEVQISYTLRSPMTVSLEIYAADGRLVSVPIAAQAREAGSQSQNIAVDGLPPGVYTLRVVAGTSSAVERFVVVR